MSGRRQRSGAGPKGWRWYDVIYIRRPDGRFERLGFKRTQHFPGAFVAQNKDHNCAHHRLLYVSNKYLPTWRTEIELFPDLRR